MIAPYHEPNKPFRRWRPPRIPDLGPEALNSILAQWWQRLDGRRYGCGLARRAVDSAIGDLVELLSAERRGGR